MRGEGRVSYPSLLAPRPSPFTMSKFLKTLFDKKPQVEKIDVARRFELLTRVGQGSMSKVWRARDAMTGRMLAVKVLDKAKTERFESRFVGMKKPSEGDISSSLQHRNIVNTIEHGTTTADEPYIVMDFVEGVPLSFLVDVQNEQMRDHCLDYIIQLGEAIEYLHRQNWIHRDICPRNVMVDQDNIVKLIDFGLVVPNTPEFQKPGNRTGTANYMAPELIKRQKTDQRIDIFSFAVTAYEMYAQRLPWDVLTQATIETVLQHINKPPTPISQLAPHIDSRVADVIMKGLISNPDDRWQTMTEVLVPLRKAHTDLESKKDIERARAVAKKKAKGPTAAALAAKAKKDAEDDAFFEQILREDSPDSKPLKRSDKDQDEDSPQKSKATKPNRIDHTKDSPTKSAKRASSLETKTKGLVPATLPDSDSDEFDGIEIEEEGHKLDDHASDDEFDGIEIEESPSDSDDEFDGIEIEIEGDLDLVASTSPRSQQSSSSPIDDDEPILRLPDDD